MKRPGTRLIRTVGRLASFAVVVGLLGFASSLAYADLPRNVVRGIPKVGGGGEVERFVLMEPVHIFHLSMFRADSMEYWMLPGQFVPVSEDAEGVFYQAARGFVVLRGSLRKKVVPGGLYVIKTRKDRIFSYVGDAADARTSLDMDRLQLLLDVRLKLKVARAERKR